MKLSDIFKQPKVAEAMAQIRGAFTPEVLAALDPEHAQAGRAIAELSLNAVIGEDPEDGAMAAVERVVTLCNDSTRTLAAATATLTRDLAQARRDLEKATEEVTSSRNALSECETKLSGATAAADLKVQAAVSEAITATEATLTRRHGREKILATCGLPDAPFLDAPTDAEFEHARAEVASRLQTLSDQGFSVNAANRSLLYADKEDFAAAVALAGTATRRHNPLAAGGRHNGVRPAAA